MRLSTASFRIPITSCVLLILAASPAAAQTRQGDTMLAEYFAHETRQLEHAGLAKIRTIEDWHQNKDRYRQQLMEMLGLAPRPERTPLHAVVTGQTERDGIVVERIHFQSRPGLYVTGNLYRPQKVDAPLPAILYVCGHAGVKLDGVSYGNKVHYQHHGAWFARNGYVCLTIDSVQLGEIESIHHGTYRYDMWWWLCRGYTPAGVEAWNCIRALDYLQSRPEVDGEKLGVTGRSGGGIYSWWVSALDDRIKAAVPVAGITDLANHVVDGCVEGHCDCMYLVNTYRWDYPHVAALVAPRPLLISNTDSDGIFPLDGVVRTYAGVRRIYDLHEAAANVALQITAGPHKDTQELRIHAFRWFNHHLNDDDRLIRDAADARFEPQELKVFDVLPDDERNTTVHEWFVPQAASPDPPVSDEAWNGMREKWFSALRTRVMAGWPSEAGELDAIKKYARTRGELRLEVFEFSSQPTVRLPLYVVTPPGKRNGPLRIYVLGEAEWPEFAAQYAKQFAGAFDQDVANTSATGDGLPRLSGPTAFLAPRGIGPTSWSDNAKKHTQYRRRFYLLGQTLDGMRVWDIRRALQLVGKLNPHSDAAVQLSARGVMAGNALYASLFEPNVGGLELFAIPSSHRAGPIFLNVQRFLDLPQAVALAADRCPVILREAEPAEWQFTVGTSNRLNWPKERLTIVGE